MTSHDHHKLSVPQVNTEWYHKSFTFNGIQEWNSLPLEVESLEQNVLVINFNLCNLCGQLCGLLYVLVGLPVRTSRLEGTLPV